MSVRFTLAGSKHQQAGEDKQGYALIKTMNMNFHKLQVGSCLKEYVDKTIKHGNQRYSLSKAQISKSLYLYILRSSANGNFSIS